MFLQCIVVAVVLVLVLNYCLSRRRLCKLAEAFPGPRAYPLIGNLHNFFRRKSFTKLQNQMDTYKKYGSLFRFWLGLKLLLYTSDPEVIERVLGNSKLITGNERGQNDASMFLRRGLLTSNGQRWRSHRKIMTSVFRTKVLEQFVDNFAKNSSALANRLSNVAEGTTIELYPYIAECGLDIICETSMGTSINAQTEGSNEYVEKTIRALKLFGARFNTSWLIPEWLYKLTKPGKENVAICKHLHNFCHDVVQRKLKEFECSGLSKYQEDYDNLPVNNPSFLDLVIRNSLLPEDDMMDEAHTLIFAGFETTSTTCAFSLCLLGEYQEIQDKVFEEQKHIFGEDLTRSVNKDDLCRMTYLEQVVKETLRLFPPVPFLTRTIDIDTAISHDRILPAGSVIYMNIFLLHHRPEHFPEPERFDPERFSVENCVGRHPYAYLPFGSGRRMCVGYKYAMMEVMTMLSTVLRRVRVTTAVDGMRAIKRELRVHLLLKSGVGFRVQLQPRQKL